MSNQVLRWGVISTSNIGRAAVIPAIGASPTGRVMAVASRDESRANEFAAKLDIPRHYGSYEALLDDDEIDAVYNPLPNSLHRAWTLEAVRRGKHVLCEKPLGLDAAECLEMGRAAESNGVMLMEAFMYRFHPRTEQVLEMVRGGEIGDLRTIRSAFTFRLTRPDNIRLDPALGGGALMDVGCYCVNVSRTLAGREPSEARATAVWGDSGVDIELAGTLGFEGGVVSQFDCALTMERREAFIVAGTDAWLRVPSAFLPGTDDVTIEVHRGRGAKESLVVAGDDEYRLMVEHFEAAVLDGQSLRYPFEEAARNMRTIEALYASARRGGATVSVGGVE